MTREEHKNLNATNYPASVLDWLNKTVDRVFDDFENRTCDGCEHISSYKCNNCSRFYKDYYKPKDTE